MQIQGRSVEAVTYGKAPVLNAYVRLKPGDCIREHDPSYQCADNCEGSIVLARFMSKQPFSIKALVPKELSVHPDLPMLAGITDLAGLEAVAAEPDFELTSHGAGKVLFYRSHQVGVYNPCGFANNAKLFSSGVGQTIHELISRVDEVYSIAENKPLEHILEDKALAAQLRNPVLAMAMAQLFGAEGLKLLELLKSKQAERT